MRIPEKQATRWLMDCHGWVEKSLLNCGKLWFNSNEWWWKSGDLPVESVKDHQKNWHPGDSINGYPIILYARGAQYPRHPNCFHHLKRFVENSWAEGWHKGMSSGQIIRTKNPPKGSVLEGEWDPGYFRKILVKVKYDFIWPHVVGSRSGGFCHGRHQLGVVLFGPKPLMFKGS